MLRLYEKFAMAVILCSCLLSTRNGNSAEPTLKVGDLAPAIECEDSDGKTWSSRDFIGKQMLVVYFYPSDFTFCCTRQAKKYQERLHEFTDAEVTIVGVSADPARVHQLFKEANQLTFSLLADEQGDIARKFGIPLRVGGKSMVKDSQGQEVRDANGRILHVDRKFTAARWTFIINKEGRIAHIVNSASPQHDSHESLKVAMQLASK